jgi:hypothetical protein
MEYYESITVIEAQERLVEMNLADYPSMKKEARQKLFRQMRKMAYPEGWQKEMDFSEFIGRMKRGR